MSQTAKVLLAFTGIFVAGAVAGGIVALRVGVEKAQQVRTAQPVSAPRIVTVDQYGPAQLDRYVKLLALEPDQKGKISPLIEQAAKRLADLTKQNRAETLTIREDLDKEVSALLTETQRTRLAEMQKNRRAQFDGMKGNGPDRGPRGGPGSPPFAPFVGAGRRNGSGASVTVSNSAPAPGPADRP